MLSGGSSAKVAIVQHDGTPLSPFALSLESKAGKADRLFAEGDALYHRGRKVSSDILQLYDLVHDETGFKSLGKSSYNRVGSLPLIDVPRHIATTRERPSRAALMMDNRKMSLLDVKTPHRAIVNLTGDKAYDVARFRETMQYPFTLRPVSHLSYQAQKLPTNYKLPATRVVADDADLEPYLDRPGNMLVEEYLPGLTAWVLIVPGLRGALTYTAIPVGKTPTGSYKPLTLTEPLKSNLLHIALETAEALFIERMVLASFRLTHHGDIALLKVNPFPSELEEQQFIASLAASGITYDELSENMFAQL